MASSLIALIDDIALILDDVAVLAKVAAKKTAGVLGDDLALNAQQVHGVAAERELPVVWAVFKGSMVNKLILVPSALLISIVAPWAITPLLMAGGAFLCFEGFEKLAHRWMHAGEPEDEREKAREQALMQALEDPSVDLAVLERDKIKGAIRTDFVLSGEIIVITLGTVQGNPWPTQLSVMGWVAVLMTCGVYGLVGAIVKIDDLGLYCARQHSTALQALGRWLLVAAPQLMKLLSVVGTAAMFLVGGGILTHGLPFVHHAVEQLLNTPALAENATLDFLTDWVIPPLVDALAGVLAGAVVLAVVQSAAWMLRKVRGNAGSHGR